MHEIDLESMIQSVGSSRFRRHHPRELRIVPDTCVLNKVRRNGNSYNFVTWDRHGNSYTVVILSEVITEVHHGTHSPHSFVRRQIRDIDYFLYYIEPEMEGPQVTLDHERLITSAWRRAREDLLVRGVSSQPDIGVADMQIISYALSNAKQGVPTVILSDDNQVRWTLFELMNNTANQLYRHVLVISPRKHYSRRTG
jgi:hypothetical protein